MNLHAGTGMGPDNPNAWVITQRLFDLLQIQRIALTPRRDIAVHHHRQIKLFGQVIHPVHRLAVGTRRLAVNQRGQGVMTSEDLPQPLPHARIQLQHAADVRIGVLVVGVKAREKGMETVTLIGRHLLQRLGNQHVGGAKPVGTAIVTGIVARPLGLVFMPLLGNRNPGQHDMLDVGLIHGLDQAVQPGTFLEEINEMQVGVTVAVLARRQRRREQQTGASGAGQKTADKGHGATPVVGSESSDCRPGREFRRGRRPQLPCAA